MKKVIFCILCIALMAACKQKEKSDNKEPVKSEQTKNTPENSAKSLAEIVGSAQHSDNFNQKEAVRLKLKVYDQSNKEKLNARISFMTDMSKVKVEKNDGTTLIFADNKSVLFPNSNAYDQAESDLWTWVNLLALPYKLTRPGTVWEGKSKDSLAGNRYDTAKIKFKNLDNRPQQDWFVIYVAPKTGFLKAVGFSENSVKKQRYPEVITYEDFISVKHIAIAKNWVFHKRKSATETLGPETGHAELSNLRFFTPPEDYFKAPKDALPINQKVEGDVVL